ncbi:MAG: class I SAM-dependent methyltransferase [Rhodobacteraceae bacterium]|nr:class I SAM-dependent methyltransferase [Paracoccaceae bacterium]
MIDRIFGVNRVLAGTDAVSVEQYYVDSERGYRWVHSADGCMHLALSSGTDLHTEDFLAQAAFIKDLIHETGATRVLELGSGQGFNLIHLARACPKVSFVGLDLLDRHVASSRKKAAKLSNIAFVQGSFEPIPAELGRFDLVFGIETLCYARDRGVVARSIAQALSPGGTHVVFDAQRAVPLVDMHEEIATAVRLYEVTTAVTQGFAHQQDWDEAYCKVGLVTQRVEDLTRSVMPGVRRLHRYGNRYFSDPLIRTATQVFPAALRRNAIGALLGPYLVEETRQSDADISSPALRYILRVASKPTTNTETSPR